MPMKKNRGFTLVELMVVLTVIALLLSVVVPDYVGRMKRAEEAVLQENLTVMRADITRPLVLQADDPVAAELVVSDGRSLASKQSIKAGDRVAVQFACTEGRTERGNLLLTIDSWRGH